MMYTGIEHLDMDAQMRADHYRFTRSRNRPRFRSISRFLKKSGMLLYLAGCRAERSTPRYLVS
jgi:hypothetical protein